jgi:hypothetical protein
MKNRSQENITIEQWLKSTGKKQCDLVELTGESKGQVSQAKKAGHYVVFNSLGEAFLIPQKYSRAFL